MTLGEQRELAAELFNAVWRLLAKPDRTPLEDEEMVHAAHASRYHWIRAGTRVNAARGEWQCSRVYAVLGRAEPALHHARRCLSLCEEVPAELEPFDLPFAYEALARAYSVAGDPAGAAQWVELARAAAAQIPAEDDRQLLEGDLETIGT